MSSTSLFLENDLCPQSCPTTKKPVNAVPAKAQANGSRYHGEMEMAYKAAAIDAKVSATADQALNGLISKTSSGRDLITSDRVTSSGSSFPMLL